MFILVLHYAIIATLLIQSVYAGYQVFFVVVPPDHAGPLFGRAMTMDPDLMMVRRMYAMEAWVAFVGLAIYLGITEVRPRLHASSVRS